VKKARKFIFAVLDANAHIHNDSLALILHTLLEKNEGKKNRIKEEGTKNNDQRKE